MYNNTKQYVILFTTLLFLSALALAALSLKSPSKCQGQWNNCANAFSDNTLRATASVTANNNKTGNWTNYSFSIPSTARINTVKVRADFFANNPRGYMDVRVTGNGGASFGPIHTIGGNTAEQTYWIDVTSDYSWTPAMLNNNNLRVSTKCFKQGSGSNPTCNLDWIPVEVTYTLFDFSVNTNPVSGTVVQGSSVATTTTVTLLGGVPQLVSLSQIGCPSAAVCSFTPTNGTPTYNSTFNVATSNTTPNGTYNITIVGTGDSKVRIAYYLLTVQPFTACNDGTDNDNDGLSDYPNDPGCSSSQDASETSSSLICDNGLDETNDADSLADYRLNGGDLGCTNSTDASEINGQCDDLADNDGDTYTDYPTDPGCFSYSDASELGSAQCDDNIDNDGDGFIDYPDDNGCSSPTDNLESTNSCTDTDGGFIVTIQGSISGVSNNTGYNYTDTCLGTTLLDEHTCSGTQPNHFTYNCTGNYTGCSNGACIIIPPQCSDGIDNDGDTYTDYPADPGCTSSSDTSELGTAPCDNGLDDDADTYTDYPDDPGCSNATDTSELGTTICDNGVDELNDRDTLVDYPDDLGCSSPTDSNEIDGDCDDRVDNDGDGTPDYPSDPGCTSYSDPSELGTVQCDNGIDDDGDGKTDYGFLDTRDSKCSSRTDNDENPRDNCTDSDGGISYLIQGAVSGDDESVSYSFIDVCIDAIQLKEYYCGSILQDYAPLNTVFNCSGNFTACFNGACV
ncbi:MAG: hypothetical protein AABX70_08565 [Nanoarchaeota archaeon]